MRTICVQPAKSACLSRQIPNPASSRRRKISTLGYSRQKPARQPPKNWRNYLRKCPATPPPTPMPSRLTSAGSQIRFRADVRNIQNSLRIIPKIVREEEAILLIMRAARKSILPHLRSATPVRTGRLRKTARVSRARGSSVGRVKIGNRKAFYTHFIEFGTNRMPKRPFFFAAIDAAEKDYVAGVGRELAALIARRTNKKIRRGVKK